MPDKKPNKPVLQREDFYVPPGIDPVQKLKEDLGLEEKPVGEIYSVGRRITIREFRPGAELKRGK